VAGVSPKKICYAHGSLQWATCCKCKRKVSAKEIDRFVFTGTVARCQAPIGSVPSAVAASSLLSTELADVSPAQRTRNILPRKRPSRKRSRMASDSYCGPLVDENGQHVCGGVMKPGITFFGEALENNVTTKLEADRDKVDALIVIGTSLSV
jgi:NAD+-dependent protein deacetylase SIR2